jgi:hypothetical protein
MQFIIRIYIYIERFVLFIIIRFISLIQIKQYINTYIYLFELHAKKLQLLIKCIHSYIFWSKFPRNY